MEKEMATHSSILAWKIPWTEEPGRLHRGKLSPWGHKELDTTELLNIHTHTHTHTFISEAFFSKSQKSMNILNRILYILISRKNDLEMTLRCLKSDSDF